MNKDATQEDFKALSLNQGATPRVFLWTLVLVLNGSQINFSDNFPKVLKITMNGMSLLTNLVIAFF